MNQPAIGIDVGSTTWKAVAIDCKGNILANLIEAVDPRIEQQSERALEELFVKSGVNRNIPIGATGYGRKRIKASKRITEITCHAKGAFHIIKESGIILDMGGQDTKVIRIGRDGEVIDFLMNDKCAAGTGRFLEVILNRLAVPYEQLPAMVAKASKPTFISPTCTVFAESEVVSLIAQGEPLEGILKGLHLSLASRVTAMLGHHLNTDKIYMSGGVALNKAMVNALSETTGREITVLPNPQFIGALGAALLVL